MKNKKAQEFSTNTIILIILGIVVLVVLIIGFSFGWEKVAPWLSQDKFTIYEQECYNLTNEEKCQLIFGEEAISFLREEGGFDCYHNLKPGEYNSSWWTPYFDTEEEINLSGELCKKVEVDRIIMPNMNCVDDEYCGILKKYLTTEFLDANCKCVGVNKPCEDLDCKNQKCLNYKCGSYIVEVK